MYIDIWTAICGLSFLFNDIFPNTWWMYGKSSATTFGTSAGAAHADSGLVLFSAPWCTKWSNRPMKRSRCFCTWFGEVSPCGWRCLLKPAFLFASPKCQVWNLTTRPVRLHWRRLWRQWRLETIWNFSAVNPTFACPSLQIMCFHRADSIW